MRMVTVVVKMVNVFNNEADEKAWLEDIKEMEGDNEIISVEVKEVTEEDLRD